MFDQLRTLSVQISPLAPKLRRSSLRGVVADVEEEEAVVASEVEGVESAVLGEEGIEGVVLGEGIEGVVLGEGTEGVVLGEEESEDQKAESNGVVKRKRKVIRAHKSDTEVIAMLMSSLITNVENMLNVQVCIFCSSEFGDSKTLVLHMSEVHSVSTTSMPLVKDLGAVRNIRDNLTCDVRFKDVSKCPLCGTPQANLNRHLKTAHALEGQAERKKLKSVTGTTAKAVGIKRDQPILLVCPFKACAKRKTTYNSRKAWEQHLLRCHVNKKEITLTTYKVLKTNFFTYSVNKPLLNAIEQNISPLAAIKTVKANVSTMQGTMTDATTIDQSQVPATCSKRLEFGAIDFAINDQREKVEQMSALDQGEEVEEIRESDDDDEWDYESDDSDDVNHQSETLESDESKSVSQSVKSSEWVFSGTVDLFLKDYQSIVTTTDFYNKRRFLTELDRVKDMLGNMGITNNLSDLFMDDTLETTFMTNFRNQVLKKGTKRKASSMLTYTVYIMNVCNFIKEHRRYTKYKLDRDFVDALKEKVCKLQKTYRKDMKKEKVVRKQQETKCIQVNITPERYQKYVNSSHYLQGVSLITRWASTPQPSSLTRHDYVIMRDVLVFQIIFLSQRDGVLSEMLLEEFNAGDWIDFTEDGQHYRHYQIKVMHHKTQDDGPALITLDPSEYTLFRNFIEFVRPRCLIPVECDFLTERRVILPWTNTPKYDRSGQRLPLRMNEGDMSKRFTIMFRLAKIISETTILNCNLARKAGVGVIHKTCPEYDEFNARGMNHDILTQRAFYRRDDDEVNVAVVQNKMKQIWSGKVKIPDSFSVSGEKGVQRASITSPTRKQIAVAHTPDSPGTPESVYRKSLKERNLSASSLPPELVPQRLKKYNLKQLEEIYSVFFKEQTFSAKSIREGLPLLSFSATEADIRSVLQSWKSKLSKN